MNRHKFTPGRRRTFVHHSRAWWWNAAYVDDDGTDKVVIMLGEEGGGIDYEFAITWIDIAGVASPRIEIFDDSWLAFAECADLFAWLAAHPARMTPEDLCAGLVALGFEDTTQTERPS